MLGYFLIDLVIFYAGFVVGWFYYGGQNKNLWNFVTTLLERIKELSPKSKDNQSGG